VSLDLKTYFDDVMVHNMCCYLWK